MLDGILTDQGKTEVIPFDDTGKMKDIPYKYAYRDGTLVKVDLDGNNLPNTNSLRPETSTSTSNHFTYSSSISNAATSSTPIRANTTASRMPREVMPQQMPLQQALPFRSLNDTNMAAESGNDEGYGGPDYSVPPASPTQPIAEESQVIIPTQEEWAPQDKDVAALSPDQLAERDKASIAYTKGMLAEGDTLVFVEYPNAGQVYDAFGFRITGTPHQVHSHKLLATGSEKLKEHFGSTKQFRVQARKKLRNRLPPGIKYVIDLTPPDEGDEAVNLTTDLSCSLGVRQWYSSEARLRIPSTLVGGKDEVAYPAPSAEPENVSEVLGFRPSTPPPRDVTLTRAAAKTERAEHQQIAEAIKLSQQDIPAFLQPVTWLDVPEYDAIRHREGIARLLRLIEGKEPRLDSATKVWTLFALAKYFECTHTVVSFPH